MDKLKRKEMILKKTNELNENEHKKNINNLKNVIEKTQNSGKWLIPSPVNKKWYEVE